MSIIKTIKKLRRSKNSHFISVDRRTYKNWKIVIKLLMKLKKNYISCEIHRSRFKDLENFVVIGLKNEGKRVKRRTSGFAKGFLEKNEESICIYCEGKLNIENATADHIIPISSGGNNCQVNLLVCCRDCNEERGNLDFKKYLFSKNTKYKIFKNIILY